MNRVTLAGTIIGAIAIMMITSTMPVYSDHVEIPYDPDTTRPMCNGEDATVWYDGGLPSGYNGWIIDYTGETVPIKFKKNKNTTGFVISGDMAKNVPDPQNDVIVGSPGPDKIAAGKGNDTVCGGGDNDQISGGRGQDDIFGNDGADNLRGGNNNDFLCDGDDDSVNGGNSCANDTDTDKLDGGKGNDTIDAQTTDAYNGGRGNDTCPDDDPLVSCENQI